MFAKHAHCGGLVDNYKHALFSSRDLLPFHYSPTSKGDSWSSHSGNHQGDLFRLYGLTRALSSTNTQTKKQITNSEAVPLSFQYWVCFLCLLQHCSNGNRQMSLMDWVCIYECFYTHWADAIWARCYCPLYCRLCRKLLHLIAGEK